MKFIENSTRYTVDENSIVYNIDKNTILKQCEYGEYKTVSIVCEDGVRRNIYVHRLVAISFIPNPENKPEVNHIDGNKFNNNISNLEWNTSSENKTHSVSIGLKDKGIERQRKLVSKTVYNVLTGQIYDSAKEASELNNIRHKTLIHMLSGHSNNNTNLKYL